MKHFRLILAAATIAASGGIAHADTLSLEGGGAASLTGIVPQTFAQFASEDGLDLQVVLGQTLTRAALKLAAGQIDMAVVPPPAYRAMTRGVGPYSKQAEQASELSGNIRALFGFPAGAFHPIVWADSGIESWNDLEGSRIFIGPPAGAASGQIQGLIELATGGLKPGEGYEGIRAPWGAAQQSFQDGQYDMYVAPAAIGSQVLNELSLQREIRILSIPAELLETENYDALIERSALAESVIPAGTYSGMANGDAEIAVVGASMMMAVHQEMSDETAYSLTRAFWSNFDSMINANALMRMLDRDSPFGAMNAPLHPGAVRYYEEAGFEVPTALLP